MSRELLEAAGFDPDEEITLTPDILCGTGILSFYVQYGALPTEQSEFERIAEIANFDLTQASIRAVADVQTVKRALKTVKASRIAEL